MSDAAAEQAAAELLSEEQAEVAKADAKKAKKLRQKLKKLAKQAEVRCNSHTVQCMLARVVCKATSPICIDDICKTHHQCKQSSLYLMQQASDIYWVLSFF